MKKARVAERRDQGRWILGEDVVERPAAYCESQATDHRGQSTGAAKGDKKNFGDDSAPLSRFKPDLGLFRTFGVD